MIVHLAVALQVAAATPAVAVRAGERATTVTAVSIGEVWGLSAEALARALGGSLSRPGGSRFRLTVPGAAFELQADVPFVRADTTVVPLVAAPRLWGASLMVPMQLLTELVPRFATGFLYDVASRELRVFTTVTTSQRPAVREQSRPPPSEVPRTPRGARRTVVVDAGHGGPDNGMSGPIGGNVRIHEKDITLAVSRLVADELRAAGLDVVMTRTRDTLIALSDRGRIANRSRGDIFISIHVNAANPTWSNPGGARGFETYFLAEAKTEEARRVEQMENESVRFETGANAPKGDPLSFIINDMAQNEHLRESNDLAESIQQGLRRIHPGPSRGVKQANFAVLRGSFMPAVLVEIGFGTNPDEAAFMADPARQRQIAAAIAISAVEYLDAYERRVGSR